MTIKKRYVLSAKSGLLPATRSVPNFFLNIPLSRSVLPSVVYSVPAFSAGRIEVVDNPFENGPKLIEADSLFAAAVGRAGSEIKIEEEIAYRLPRPLGDAIETNMADASGSENHRFIVIDEDTRSPISFAKVIAFTDFQRRIGVTSYTDFNGRTTLQSASRTFERITAKALQGTGYWPAVCANHTLGVENVISLPRLRPEFVDIVRHLYPTPHFDASTGVKIGVVDSGCGPNDDLNIVGGRNLVTGEPASDFSDAHIHGTHVAGIIGSKGTAFPQTRGLAAGIPIMSYRVLGKGAQGATNYSIVKALIYAALDGCDIVNLSFGDGPESDVVQEAVRDVRENGMLVVIAAGNNYRSRVSFPAAYPGGFAVSALGIEGFFPANSSDTLQVARPPFSQDNNKEFVGHFSNTGAQISAIGPGVAIVSTLPDNKVGVESGTSMAAPVVAGVAACLLSRNKVVASAPRDRSRSNQIEKLLVASCRQRGFGLEFEGFGLPILR